ncbi:MAG: DUF4129 domain-containing protein [Bacteroidota bacterium]
MAFLFALAFGLYLPASLPTYALAKANPSDQSHASAGQADSIAVAVRQPPTSVLSAYRDNPDYAYRQRTDQALTFWQKVRRMFLDWLSRIFDTNNQGSIWEYVMYGVAIGLVLFAVLRVMKMDFRALFSPRDGPVPEIVELPEELRQETNFIALAEAATNEGHFRLAARMYYMHVLRALDANNIIGWSPRKTNQDYLKECRNSDIHTSFRRLTYLFDYAWYGDFPVDQAHITEMQVLAQDVAKRVG